MTKCPEAQAEWKTPTIQSNHINVNQSNELLLG